MSSRSLLVARLGLLTAARSLPLARASLSCAASAGPAPRALRTASGAAAAAPADGNIDVIRQEFRKQASLYSPHPRAIDFVMSEVGEVSGRALDVASGTGAFALALAPLCERVVSFDATEEMQARARQAAQQRGLLNVDFRLGDGRRLPFADGEFDVVVSRLAIHHFADPGAIVSEMARVTRPGGLVVVADIVADDDAAQHAETDRLEILRDPSHTACVTLRGLHELLRATGRVEVRPHSGNVYMHPMGADWWMDNTETPAQARAEIRRSLEAELAGGQKTGMKPFLDERGELHFIHRYAVAQGVRV